MNDEHYTHFGESDACTRIYADEWRMSHEFMRMNDGTLHVFVRMNDVHYTYFGESDAFTRIYADE